MSIDTISPLRQRMIEDMNARKLCAATETGHIRSCKRFAAFLKRSPDTATAEDIRRFQLHLAETGVSICNRNRIMTGLRFLFRVTLRRLELAAEIYHIREPQKIPLVMNSFFPPDLHAMTSRSLAGKVTYIGPWLTTVASLAVPMSKLRTMADALPLTLAVFWLTSRCYAPAFGIR
jgi:hypothetical protein